jgi:CBS domain containing-hemolysin-like protein
MSATSLIAQAAPMELSLFEFSWQVCLILFFVLLNGFFVAAEFAIVKVRSSQLEELLAKGGRNSRRARAASHVVSNLDVYLSATQLGITLASIGLGMLGERYVEHFVEVLLEFVGIDTSATTVTLISFPVAFGVITFLHIVLGELLPKSIAIRKALPTALFVSGPLGAFRMLFRPAIWFLNGTANQILKLVFRIDPVSGEGEMGHSEEELRLLVMESSLSNNVTETERDIFVNALELNDRLTREVMTPRSRVVVLDSGASFEENLKVALDSKHTRFPLVEGHLDTPQGIIHVKDMLSIVHDKSADLSRIMRQAVRVPEMMPLDKLLQVFLRKHAHMALVVDEFGGSVGIVTLDNVIEELIGNIQDEFDTEEQRFQRVDENEFFVDGTFPLYELSEYCDLKLEHPDVATVGGYVTDLLGHLPTKGEQIDIEGYQVTTEQTDGRRIIRLRFRKTSTSAVA